MLIFPQGVELSTFTDISFDLNQPNRITRNSHSIEPGYVIGHNYDYAEVNIDAPQVWSLFKSLCETLLPEEVQPYIFTDDDILHGICANKAELLNFYERFQFYLANDCNFGFGFESSTRAGAGDIYVGRFKEFQVWTKRIDSLQSIMKEYGLRQVDNLQSIQQLPLVTMTLKYDNDLDGYYDLIEYLLSYGDDF